tara:strand:- start:242 stop:1423 length:1182 start_codon:yes stop_codon:yes gene_type:complete
MSFFGRQIGISDKRGTRKTISKVERQRLKEYTGDTDPDDMASMFISDLLKYRKAQLPIDYRFVVQMTIILYYDEYFLRKIKDAQTRYKMKQLREKVDESFEQKIDIMMEKFNEELLEDDRLEQYREYLTKDNLLRELVDNINSLLVITSKAKVATEFSIESDLTLYSGLGYLHDCDKLMLENLLYLKMIGEREWITPTFISTTHSKDTSVRFTGRLRNDSDKSDVLRIIVPANRLKYFPYSPMYDRVIQLPMSRDDTTRESEVLLPPYMKLAYLGEEEERVRYLVPRGEDREPIEQTSSIVFHNLMFIDYADKLGLEDKDIDEQKIVLGESKYKDPLTISEELKRLFIRKRGGRKHKKKNNKVTKKKKRVKKLTRKYHKKKNKKSLNKKSKKN